MIAEMLRKAENGLVSKISDSYSTRRSGLSDLGDYLSGSTQYTSKVARNLLILGLATAMIGGFALGFGSIYGCGSGGDPYQQEVVTNPEDDPNFQPDPNYFVPGTPPPQGPNLRARELALYSDETGDYLRDTNNRLHQLPYRDSVTKYLYFMDGEDMIELPPWLFHEFKSGPNAGAIIRNYPRQ